MIAIYQPYFLPWLGFFPKLYNADTFLVLDDVLFSKRHYLDRAKIINMNYELQWINVPVGQNMHCPINKVGLPSFEWLDRILQTLYYSYHKSAVFEENWELICPILESIRELQPSNLSAANVYFIMQLCRLLDINIVIESSSLLNLSHDPTQRIIEACRKLDDNAIIVGDGKGAIAQDYELLISNGIHVFRQDYYENHPQYPQLPQKIGFQKGLSVLDALLCVGVDRTKLLLRQIQPYMN